MTGTSSPPAQWSYQTLGKFSCLPALPLVRLLIESLRMYRAILHDSEVYPEPERFLPERFVKDGKLNPDIMDPATVAFGFGRR